MFQIKNSLSENKDEQYTEILEYANMLMNGETDYIANTANISALLSQLLENINWVGFYIARDVQLVLGPFQGKSACIRIDKGRGVCGTAFETKETQLVDDVHAFPGHIACDSQSMSEIVVPVIHHGKVVAVLDIDSPILNRFDETDQKYLEMLCHVISKCCIWANLN